MNTLPVTPAAPPPSDGVTSLLKNARSRQEAVVTGWTALALAVVCALFQFWAGLGLLLVAIGFWDAIRKTDARQAWRIPLSTRPLGAEVALVLANALLALPTMVIFPVLLFSGALSLGVPGGKLAGVAMLCLAIAGFVGLARYCRRTIESWPVLGIFWLLSGSVAGYQLLDDPEFKLALTVADLGPKPPQAEESWAATLKYTARPGQPVRELTGPRVAVGSPGANPDLYAARLGKSRESIQAAWAALALERAWFDAMNAFPSLADLTPSTGAAPMMRTEPFRAVVQTGAAFAGLLALDGRGDEAIDVLLPLLAVSRKLEPSSRTIRRFMIARNGQDHLLQTARFVLARARVSAEKRAALATALDGGRPGAEGVRHLLLIDYAWSYENHYSKGFAGFIRPTWAYRTLAIMARPFYLERATANLHADFLATLEALAVKRDLAGLARAQEDFERGRWRTPFKNPMGNTMVMMMNPSVAKIVERFWEAESDRLALLAELRAP